MAKRRVGDLETLLDEITAWGDDVNDTQRGVEWHENLRSSSETKIRRPEKHAVTQHEPDIEMDSGGHRSHRKDPHNFRFSTLTQLGFEWRCEIRRCSPGVFVSSESGFSH